MKRGTGGRLRVLGGTTSALLGVVTLGTILGILRAKRLGVVIHKQDIAELEQLALLCASSQLSAVVDRIYPFEQIQDAFARFASGKFVGKIVVSIDAALRAWQPRIRLASQTNQAMGQGEDRRQRSTSRTHLQPFQTAFSDSTCAS